MCSKLQVLVALLLKHEVLWYDNCLHQENNIQTLTRNFRQSCKLTFSTQELAATSSATATGIDMAKDQVVGGLFPRKAFRSQFST